MRERRRRRRQSVLIEGSSSAMSYTENDRQGSTRDCRDCVRVGDATWGRLGLCREELWEPGGLLELMG